MGKSEDCIRHVTVYQIEYDKDYKLLTGFASVIYWYTNKYVYTRNDPKFSDRYAGANSADPDQTRGAV